jgi:hypothetical protein
MQQCVNCGGNPPPGFSCLTCGAQSKAPTPNAVGKRSSTATADDLGDTNAPDK